MTYRTTRKILSAPADQITPRACHAAASRMVEPDSQQGVTLLLAVLLLSAILAISFSLATILLFQVRNSEDFAQTTGALYAADGVAEQALFNTERQVATTTYVSSFNNNAALASQPVFTSTTTPTFNDTVPAGSNFINTKNRYDFCGATATTAGCGYGKLTLTYLSTGHSDPLIVYLCQFDPNEPVVSSSSDPRYGEEGTYASLPCSSDPEGPQVGDNYWVTTSGITNGSGDNQASGDGPTYPNGTLMTPNTVSTITWSLDASLQQQLVLFDPASDGNPIYVSIKTFAADGVTPLGLPFSGKTAVSVDAVNGETGRKIQVVVPTPGNGANVIGIPIITDVVPTSSGDEPWSIFVSGNYAYVGSYNKGTMSIYDISTPGTAVFVNSTSANLTANTWDIYVSGNYAYALNYNTPYNMAVFNIQNPHSITAYTPVPTPDEADDGQPDKVFVSGNYAYVLTKLDSLLVYNVSVPTSISLVGTYDGSRNVNSCRGLYVSFPYAYITCDDKNTLQILNVATPSAITALGSISTNLDTPYSVYVSGKYAYVANWSDIEGISIFDISNPNSIVALGHNSSNVNSAQSIGLVGNEAYILNAESGTLAMFNVADVNNIIENNEISVGSPWSPGNMFISGQYGYITNYGDGNITVLKFP